MTEKKMEMETVVMQKGLFEVLRSMVFNAPLGALDPRISAKGLADVVNGLVDAQIQEEGCEMPEEEAAQ